MRLPFENIDYKWRHCVVGNIVRDRIDENGVLRHGCKEFRMGTRVYLYGRYFDGDRHEYIDVLGLDRFGRYRVVEVPKEYIENVRCSRVYKPSVLKIMNNREFSHEWWDDSKEDKEDVKEFVRRWNEHDYLGFEYDLRALLQILRYRYSDTIETKLSENVLLRSDIDGKYIEGIDTVMSYLESFHHELKNSDTTGIIYANDVRFADGLVKECIVIYSKIPNNNRFVSIDLDEDQKIKTIWISYLSD